jgi:hypothetical protein
MTDTAHLYISRLWCLYFITESTQAKQILPYQSHKQLNTGTSVLITSSSECVRFRFNSVGRVGW